MHIFNQTDSPCKLFLCGIIRVLFLGGLLGRSGHEQQIFDITVYIISLAWELCGNLQIYLKLKYAVFWN